MPQPHPRRNFLIPAILSRYQRCSKGRHMAFWRTLDLRLFMKTGFWIASEFKLAHDPPFAKARRVRHRSCGVLVFALDEVCGEGFERGCSFAEGSQGFEGVGDELLGVFEGLVDAVDGGPGGLDAGGVFACGLA